MHQWSPNNFDPVLVCFFFLHIHTKSNQQSANSQSISIIIAILSISSNYHMTNRRIVAINKYKKMKYLLDKRKKSSNSRMYVVSELRVASLLNHQIHIPPPLKSTFTQNPPHHQTPNQTKKKTKKKTQLLPIIQSIGKRAFFLLDPNNEKYVQDHKFTKTIQQIYVNLRLNANQ